MGLFKKKTISERINKKWTTKTCSLQKLEDILLEEDIIEIWVRNNDTYFQIGSSSDGDKKGFFDKIYFINFSTELSLYKLLNNKMTDDGFFSSEDIKTLFNAQLIGGKTLTDIWDDCVIVAVDEMSPDNYLGI